MYLSFVASITWHSSPITIHPSPSQFCVLFLACDYLYTTRVKLSCHYLTCFIHIQFSCVKVAMPLALLSFSPSFAWACIAFVIIDAFHLGLPHPWSYHQISYVIFCQCSTCLVYSFSSYDHQPIWHCSLPCIFVFPFLVFCIFVHEVIKKGIKRLMLTFINM